MPSVGFGVLLAAHGERRDGADNASVAALAAELARRGAADEIGYGFINAAPTIAAALGGFAADDILVYPLFMSDGWFTRVRLPELLAAAGAPSRRVAILPALGLEPGLADLIAGKAATAASRRGWSEREVSVVLLAHGSSKDAASRNATQAAAAAIGARHRFAAVACAFLEEAPTLIDCVSGLRGPRVVIGLFVGDGLHGGEDVPALMDALGPDVAFGGNVGAWPEIADLVTASIRAHWGGVARLHHASG